MGERESFALVITLGALNAHSQMVGAVTGSRIQMGPLAY
jgi:hypothetical protein